jgi:hypothetical protein
MKFYTDYAALSIYSSIRSKAVVEKLPPHQPRLPHERTLVVTVSDLQLAPGRWTAAGV